VLNDGEWGGECGRKGERREGEGKGGGGGEVVQEEGGVSAMGGLKVGLTGEKTNRREIWLYGLREGTHLLKWSLTIFPPSPPSLPPSPPPGRAGLPEVQRHHQRLPLPPQHYSASHCAGLLCGHPHSDGTPSVLRGDGRG